MSPLVNMAEDLKYVHQIRDQYYHIELWFYNQIKDQKPFMLPFMFVHSLAIEESILDFPIKGWMVIKSDHEIFERGASSVNKGTSDVGNVTHPQVAAPYIFRTDGRNRLSIRIYPLSVNPTKDNTNSVADTLPHELWEMNFDCVIYDIEDLPTGNVHEKRRKLYFHDERLQILKERNLEWSTAKYGPNGGKYPATDAERAWSTSPAIQNLLLAAASNDSDPNTASLKVGYDEKGSIDAPNIDFASFGDWDDGPAADHTGTTLYTSPAFSCALDDINSLLENAIGKDNTPVLLTFGRWMDDKTWNLTSLQKYITDAEKNQIERLVLEDGGDATSAPPYIARAPDGNTDIQNFMSGIASRITRYKFAPMVSSDDARISNKPLHNYDFGSGQFNIFCKDNTALKVASNLQDLAKSGLYSYGKSQQVLLNVNKTKQTGLITSPQHSTQVFFNRNAPALSMLKDALFLNEALYFQAPGLTFRTPGKFIFVDSVASSNENNPFDDRFLGQWLMTRVVHLFTRDDYVCDVVSTKVDAFSKIFEVVDTNY